MIKKAFQFYVITLFFLVNALAQNNNIIGTIINKHEKTTVKNVVVAIINAKDSNLVKFIRTDAEGKFELKNLKNGQYLLMTTHPLFVDYIDSIVVNNTTLDLGNLMLLQKSKLLEAVILKNASAIRIKGDTIVYTADSFKVKNGANIEDLLKKMPGFQVGKNGNIKTMGETVKNILVDGEEFFGSDPGMVVKNLQANIVQEVQVYDKKSNQANFTGVDDGVREKTINLKLKSIKKQGYFGKVEASGGTPNNFNNNAMLNAFAGKRKFSTYGLMKNTDNQDTNWQNADSFNGSDDVSNNGNSGIPTNWNGGVQYSNKYRGDNIGINASYGFGKISSPGFSNILSKTFLPDTSWSNNSVASSISNKQKHNFSFKFENKIDSNNTISFSVGFGESNTKTIGSNYEETLSSNSLFINNSSRNFNANSDSKGYSGSFDWGHKFKKQRRTLFTYVNMDISGAEGNRFVYALNNFYKAGLVTQLDTIDQKTITKSSSKLIIANVSYTEPISKYVTLSFYQMTTLNFSGNNRNVYNKNGIGKYENSIDSLTNDFNFNTTTYRTGISLSLGKKKITASIGNSLALTNFNQTNNSIGTSLNYSNKNIAPNASIFLTLKGYKKIRISYNGNNEAPSLRQLQPIADNSNLLSIAKGNPDLKQAFRHTLTSGFIWSKPLSNRSIWCNLNFNTTNNAFIIYNSIDSLGRNINQTVNANGKYNFSSYLSARFTVGVGKNKIEFRPALSFSKGQNISFVNKLKNINKSHDFNFSLEISKSKDEKYDIGISPNISFSNATSSINKNSSQYFWNVGGDIYVDIEFKHKLTFSTNANFSFRKKDAFFTQNNDFIKWNAEAKKYIYKNELSLKLSVNDILNQDRGYNRDFSTFKISENYYNILKRYWLLAINWEFRYNKNQKENKVETAVPTK